MIYVIWGVGFIATLYLWHKFFIKDKSPWLVALAEAILLLLVWPIALILIAVTKLFAHTDTDNTDKTIV